MPIAAKGFGCSAVSEQESAWFSQNCLRRSLTVLAKRLAPWVHSDAGQANASCASENNGVAANFMAQAPSAGDMKAESRCYEAGWTKCNERSYCACHDFFHRQCFRALRLPPFFNARPCKVARLPRKAACLCLPRNSTRDPTGRGT